MADRIQHLSSLEAEMPTGVWNWAKRLVEELNKWWRLMALVDVDLTGKAGWAVKVKSDLSGYELAVDLTGSGGYTVVTKTAGYTEATTSGELIVLCTLTAGFTIGLPTAVGNTATFTFKKTLAAGQITIDGAGAETIDGGLTAVLNNLDESITIKSDNANWRIV